MKRDHCSRGIKAIENERKDKLFKGENGEKKHGGSSNDGGEGNGYRMRGEKVK